MYIFCAMCILYNVPGRKMCLFWYASAIQYMAVLTLLYFCFSFLRSCYGNKFLFFIRWEYVYVGFLLVYLYKCIHNGVLVDDGTPYIWILYIPMYIERYLYTIYIWMSCYIWNVYKFYGSQRAISTQDIIWRPSTFNIILYT